MSRQSKSSTSKKIRYAVVGVGHLAQVAVLPGFSTAKNSELVALVSGDPEKQRKLAGKYGLTQTFSYEDYDRALAAVDAVYLTVPNHLHREYAVRALDKGIHVLCEKPMAVTAEECEAMIHAGENSGAKLMIAYRLHFERGNLDAIKIGQSGQLGELRIFTSEFAQQVADGNIRITEPESRGGGAIYDMGVYCINAARYLFGEDPTEVFAASANNGDPRFNKTSEMTSVVMRFPNEQLASFTCSFGAVDISRYTLIGTKGKLTYEPAYDYSMALKRQLNIDEKTTSKTFPKRDQFAAELVYFSDCILHDKQPEPSGLEGLADVRIVQAILESARTKGPVEVPQLPAKKKVSPGQEIHRPAHGKPKTVNAKSPSGEAA
ncbi:MAG: Gfo/Idh/MocA family oxidoreductase [Candidatus Sulfotelmatobacter sp.]